MPASDHIGEQLQLFSDDSDQQPSRTPRPGDADFDPGTAKSAAEWVQHYQLSDTHDIGFHTTNNPYSHEAPTRHFGSRNTIQEFVPFAINNHTRVYNHGTGDYDFVKYVPRRNVPDANTQKITVDTPTAYVNASVLPRMDPSDALEDEPANTADSLYWMLGHHETPTSSVYASSMPIYTHLKGSREYQEAIDSGAHMGTFKNSHGVYGVLMDQFEPQQIEGFNWLAQGQPAPYENSVEDHGSLSWVVPRGAEHTWEHDIVKSPSTSPELKAAALSRIRGGRAGRIPVSYRYLDHFQPQLFKFNDDGSVSTHDEAEMPEVPGYRHVVDADAIVAPHHAVNFREMPYIDSDGNRRNADRLQVFGYRNTPRSQFEADDFLPED